MGKPLVSQEIATAVLDSWDMLAGQQLQASTTWLTGNIGQLMDAPAGTALMSGPEYLLVVPSDLEKAGEECVKAERNAAGATNVAFGKAELVVSEELSAIDPQRWYLIRGGLAVVLRPKSPDYHYIIPATGSEVKELQEGKGPDTEDSDGFQVKGTIPRWAPNKVGIDRARLKSDQLGMTNAQVQELTNRIVGHLPLLAAKALDGGRSDLNYDEKATFATDHYVDPRNKKGSQSNSLNLALNPDNFYAARTRQRGFVARDKQPFGRSSLPFLYIIINENPEPLLIGPGHESYENTKRLEYGITVRWTVRCGRWWQALTSKP